MMQTRTKNRKSAANRLRRWAEFLFGLALIHVPLVVHKTPFHSAMRAKPVLGLLCLAAGVALGFLYSAGLARATVGRIIAAKPARYCSALFLVSLAINVTVVWVVFGGVPRIDDGVAALFQARIFGRFAVTLPLPPEAGFYQQFGVLGARYGAGRWCGMYPPGWSALLTPGVWVGMPWLVNPLLGASLCVALSRLGENLFGRTTGRVAGVLALSSPFVYVLSALHLSHTATALACVLCCLCLHRLLKTHCWHWGIAAGTAWGVAFLCRPLTAIVVGSVFALMIVVHPRNALRGWRGVLAGAAAAAIVGSLLFAFQAATTGDPMVPGHELGLGARGKFGFGCLDGRRTHTPSLGADHTRDRIRALNDNMLGWPLPALALLGIPFAMRRSNRYNLLLLLPLAGLLTAYACFWYYEVYFPARYASSAVPFAIILAANGLVVMGGAAERVGGIRRKLFGAGVTASVLFVLCVSTYVHLQRYGSRFGDVETILPKVMEAQGIRNAVVLMDSVGRADGELDPLNDYFATGFMRNDLDLENDVIFARNSREQNVKILKHYPGRRFYHYRYVRSANRALLYELIRDGNAFERVRVPPATPLVVSEPPMKQ